MLSPLFLALLLVSPHASAKAPGESKQARTAALFIIRCEEECGLEPIALLSQGRFLPPVADASSESDVNRFLATYFKKERPYDVFFRGSRVGRVRVKEGEFVHTFHATARPEAPLPFQTKENEWGLATDAQGVTGHPRPPRVAPSSEEKAQVTRLAKALLKKKGVSARSLQKLESTSLWVTQLDDTSGKRILASFRLEDESREFIHSLMLIARPTPAELVLEFTGYLKSETGEQQGHEFFVDHLDLDGDGVDELVTQMMFYEAVQYQIYKRTTETWKRVYAGGGGGI